jgi:hypothetical protein
MFGGHFTFDLQLVVHALTPGRLSTVFSARDLWDASATVPVRVTAPFLDSVLMESP